MKRFQTWLEKNDILASREKLMISVTSVEERYLQIRSGVNALRAVELPVLAALLLMGDVSTVGIMRLHHRNRPRLDVSSQPLHMALL